jgi:hypothetical protein
MPLQWKKNLCKCEETRGCHLLSQTYLSQVVQLTCLSLQGKRSPKEGLVYIRQPWESGIDNSPTWDDPLKRIINGALLPHYERKELLSGVDPKMRPGDKEYDRYVYLADLFSTKPL